MNMIWDSRIDEVYGHLKAGDTSLAVRRMIDCAIETENMEIFREVTGFCKSATDYDYNTLSAETMRRLLEKIRGKGVKNNIAQNEEILKVSHLSKTYAGGNFKVTNVSFDLRAGEIIGLVGENGNGKTTLLRIIATELMHDSGTIEYKFTKQTDNYSLRTQLVYIEQRIPKWYGKLMDNLQFMLAHYGKKGEENLLWAEIMLARMGLLKFRNHGWNQLSSGYRTRFEIARTLLRRPKILLLDEPLANLDILAQQTILQDLKFMSSSLSAPFGMLLSSQHIYEVEKVSDKNIFLKNGTPQYQESASKDTASETPATQLIFELEASGSRDEIQMLFANSGLEKIQYNGGVYMIFFSAGKSQKSVLSKLAEADFDVVYFRNISHSSRRFFIN